MLWERLAKGLVDLTSPVKVQSILVDLITLVTIKRPDGPDKSSEAKRHYSKVNKHLGETKKSSKVDIHADKFQSKSTAGVRVNSKCKSAQPVEDLRNHHDRLYQVL